MSCWCQVHEEFSYGFSEQLLRARAADQVNYLCHCHDRRRRVDAICFRTCASVELCSYRFLCVGFHDSTPNSRPGTAEREANWGECTAAGMTHARIIGAVLHSVLQQL